MNMSMIEPVPGGGRVDVGFFVGNEMCSQSDLDFFLYFPYPY